MFVHWFSTLRALPDECVPGYINRYRNLRQLPHKLHYPVAQQRLPARQAHFRDPHPHQNSRHPQIIRKRQVSVERAFVSRAAVHTLVVTAVGDGNPQVGDAAPEFVVEKHRRFGRKENKQAGPSRRLSPFQCAPRGTREAPALSPAESLSLAASAWVHRKAGAIGNSIWIIDARGP